MIAIVNIGPHDGRDQKAAGVGRLNPGSDEAIAAGCTCPVIDNGYGRGCMDGVKDEQGRTVFVIRLDCPLHGIAEEHEK